jgi:hypothetical protein
MPLELHPDLYLDQPLGEVADDYEEVAVASQFLLALGQHPFVSLELADDLGLSYDEHVAMEAAIHSNFVHVVFSHSLSYAQRAELLHARVVGGNAFFALLAQHLSEEGPYPQHAASAVMASSVPFE